MEDAHHPKEDRDNRKVKLMEKVAGVAGVTSADAEVIAVSKLRRMSSQLLVAI